MTSLAGNQRPELHIRNPQGLIQPEDWIAMGGEQMAPSQKEVTGSEEIRLRSTTCYHSFIRNCDAWLIVT